MRKIIASSTVMLTIFISSCATQKQPSQKVAENELAEEIVCIRTQKVGSRMKKKQCMTKSERERRRQASQDRLQQDQDSEALRTLDPRAGGSGP